MYLEKINGPRDLHGLSPEELEALAAEIRERIVAVVAENGGHLASNLGTVELTIALHLVFDSPREPVFFDVGHQCYTHKLLTGRVPEFSTLRRTGGLSGFPHPGESPHDPAFAGHSGSALSLALGVAAAQTAAGSSAKVVAVLGDASLNNGITLEALNSTADGGKNLIIVLNDNRMSITKSVGALRKCLNRIVSSRRYNRLRRGIKDALSEHRHGFRIASWFREELKRLFFPPGAWFEELGLRYFGPVAGHSLAELIPMLERMKKLDGPLLLHVVTEKGHGCGFAAKNPTDYHGVKGYSMPDGELKPSRPGFSAAFGNALCKLAEEHSEVVAVAAAMLPGVGLAGFAKRFPDRCYDVGIAEEHAAIFSAGLALAGKRPVCAIYSTFMQRALDCVAHDAVLGKVPVIFALDRAGAVADGPTHHGIYDPGFLRGLPGLTIMDPADEDELAAMLEFAYTLNAPAVIRYPSGGGARHRTQAGPLVLGRARIVADGDAGAPVLWSLGAELDTAVQTAEFWKEKYGEACTVVDARFLKPFDAGLARKLAERPMVTIEDGAACGGLFSALAEALAPVAGTKILSVSWPDRTIPHGNVAELRRMYGFGAPEICARMAAEFGKRAL